MNNRLAKRFSLYMSTHTANSVAHVICHLPSLSCLWCFHHISYIMGSLAMTHESWLMSVIASAARAQVSKQLKLRPEHEAPMIEPFLRFGNTSSSSTWCAPSALGHGRRLASMQVHTKCFARWIAQIVTVNSSELRFSLAICPGALWPAFMALSC